MRQAFRGLSGTAFLLLGACGDASSPSPPDNGTPNAPPTARIAWSCEGLACTFDGQTSSDDDRVVSYSWDLGRSPNPTATGAVVTATYSQEGQRTVTLTVKDAGGLSNSASSTLTLPLSESSRAMDGTGGEVSLSDGARFEVPAGAIQGRIAFRLRRLEDSTGGTAPATRAALRNASVSGCVANGASELTITPERKAAFLEGNNQYVLRLPSPCAPAAGQSLYVRAQVSGAVGLNLWKPAAQSAGSSTATLSFGQVDFVSLNALGTMSISFQPVRFQEDDPLSCSVGADEYPMLQAEPDDNGTGPRTYAVVLVHGWLPRVYDCAEAFSFNGAFTGDNPALPGSAYFRAMLASLRGSFPDARLFTYTYPTYRPFDEPGRDLADKLSARFGPGGSSQDIEGLVLVGHSMGGLVARVAAKSLQPPVASKLRGLITLGTPHAGTRAPELKWSGYYVLDAGAFAPGGKSLLPGAVSAVLSAPEKETTPMFAYGGNLEGRCQTRWPPLPAACEDPDAGVYKFTWNVFCSYITCDTDGVVPIGSAAPTGLAAPTNMRQRLGTKETWQEYTHSELKNGRGDGFLFASIAADIRSLLPAVEPPTPFVAIVAGSQQHTCALTGAGAAYCWGGNQSAQLGNGTSVDATTPVAVIGGLTFQSLAVGGQYTCGLVSSSPSSLSTF